MRRKNRNLKSFIKRIRVIFCSITVGFWLIGLLPVAGIAQANSRTYLDEGIRQYQEERFFKAIDLFQNALKINPYYGDAYRYLGEVYFSIGDYEMSLESALKALKYAHSDVDAMLLVANSYRELGKYQQAEEYYQNIRNEFPSYGEVYRNMGELYLKMNRLSQSYMMLSKAMRIAPDSWRNFISLGDYYYKNNDMPKAEEYYQMALKLNSRERYPFLKVAEFLY